MPQRQLTAAKIKAKCGHEYSTLLLYANENELRQQIADLARFDCVECVKRRQGEIDSASGMPDAKISGLLSAMPDRLLP